MLDCPATLHVALHHNSLVKITYHLRQVAPATGRWECPGAQGRGLQLASHLALNRWAAYGHHSYNPRLYTLKPWAPASWRRLCVLPHDTQGWPEAGGQGQEQRGSSLTAQPCPCRPSNFRSPGSASPCAASILSLFGLPRLIVSYGSRPSKVSELGNPRSCRVRGWWGTQGRQKGSDPSAVTHEGPGPC